MMEAAAASKNRFLVRDNRLHPVSPNPVKILSSSYLSGAAKWRLFTERFQAAQPSAAEETVASFIQRRFNREICDYLFDQSFQASTREIRTPVHTGSTAFSSTLGERIRQRDQKGLFKNKAAMGGRKIVAFRGGNSKLVKHLQLLLTTPRFGLTAASLLWNVLQKGTMCSIMRTGKRKLSRRPVWCLPLLLMLQRPFYRDWILPLPNC